MPITLKDFYESGKATEEQKGLLEGFINLVKEEHGLLKRIGKKSC